MIKPPASRAQMVENTLTNRAPTLCPICDRYIATFTGLPVILDDKAQIIVFAHPGCCAPDELTAPLPLPQERGRRGRKPGTEATRAAIRSQAQLARVVPS